MILSVYIVKFFFGKGHFFDIFISRYNFTSITKLKHLEDIAKLQVPKAKSRPIIENIFKEVKQSVERLPFCSEPII